MRECVGRGNTVKAINKGTETELLNAILSDPDDDAPRLIYADWLQENGEEEYAEFIRIQCELFKHIIPPRMTVETYLIGENEKTKDSAIGIIDYETIGNWQGLQSGCRLDFIAIGYTGKESHIKEDCIFVGWMGHDLSFGWRPLHELDEWSYGNIDRYGVEFTHVPGLWAERDKVIGLLARQYEILGDFNPDTSHFTGIGPYDNRLYRLTFHSVFDPSANTFKHGEQELSTFVIGYFDRRHPGIRLELIDPSHKNSTQPQEYMTLYFERGFPSVIALTFENYVAYGPSLIAYHPVRRWLINDVVTSNRSLDHWDDITKFVPQPKIDGQFRYPHNESLQVWLLDCPSSFQATPIVAETWRDVFYEMKRNCLRLEELGSDTKLFGYGPRSLYFLDEDSAQAALSLAMTTLALRRYNRQTLEFNLPAKPFGECPRFLQPKFI